MIKKLFNEIKYFLLISFLLPLIAIFIQSLTSNTISKFIFYGIEASAPSIAGLIIIVKQKNTKLFLDENIKRKKVIYTIVIAVIIAFTTMFLAKLLFCFYTNNYHIIGSISNKQLIIILWALVAEEIGWRGYLQPLLDKHIKGSFLVPFVLGIIWGLWHYHYYISQHMQIPFILLCVGCIVDSYIYYYVGRLTKNNFLFAMFYHFAWNLGIHLFAINPMDNGGSLLPYLLVIIIEVVFILSLFLQKKNVKQQ